MECGEEEGEVADVVCSKTCGPVADSRGGGVGAAAAARYKAIFVVLVVVLRHPILYWRRGDVWKGVGMGEGKKMGEEVKFAFVDPTFRELALDGLEEGGGEGVRELVLMEVKMAMLDLMRVMVKMCPMEAFVGDEGEGRMLRQQLRLISCNFPFF
jgi:hypothetical protein